jgi:hypothetical protein
VLANDMGAKLGVVGLSKSVGIGFQRFNLRDDVATGVQSLPPI